MILTQQKIENLRFDGLTKEEISELYYRLENLDVNLSNALHQAREEPGLTLKDISNIIKKVLGDDAKVLAKELLK